MDVQEMKNARLSHTVIYAEYLKKANNYKKVCFVEGEDDRLYYSEQTRALFEEEVLFICCKGKDNLIKLLQLITENKSKTKTSLMFLMDCDYDNKTLYKKIYRKNKKHLYILEVYSIENLYLSNNCMEKILKREYGMTAEDEDFQKEIKRYNQLILDTQDQFKNMNYAFYIVREVRGDLDVRFSGITKSKIFSYVQSNHIIRKQSLSLSDIANALKIEDFSEDEKRLASDFFKEKNLMKCGRGHNHIWIMEIFLHDLYLRNKDKKLSKIYTCNVDCSNFIISHCAYAADKPESLISFIRKH